MSKPESREDMETERSRQEAIEYRKEVLRQQRKNTSKEDGFRMPSSPRRARSAGGSIYNGRYRGIVKTKVGQEFLHKSDNKNGYCGEVRASTTSAATRPRNPRPSNARAVSSAPSNSEGQAFDVPDPNDSNNQEHTSVESSSGVIINAYQGYPESTRLDVKHSAATRMAHALSSRIRPSTVNATPIHCEKISKNESSDFQNWDLFRGGIGSTCNNTQTSKFNSFALKRDFKDFSLSDALRYLTENPDCPYLHVTSKIYMKNIAERGQSFAECTFYDLFILGLPGKDRSGSLISSDGLLQQKLLSRNCLMQLSLKGLLYTDGASQLGEFVSIDDFIRQSEVVQTLRKKIVFRQFLKRKVILFWKKYVSFGVFSLNRERIANQIIFANAPILQAVQRVKAATFQLEASVDLYAFHQPGSLNLTDFMLLQKEKIERISHKLKNMVHQLGHHLKKTYETLTGFAYINFKMQDVIKKHPYSSTFQELRKKFEVIAERAARGENIENEEWDQIRGVSRLLFEQKTNMERICQLSQFMVENSLLRIMFNFWSRLSRAIFGIHKVEVKTIDGHQVALWGSEEEADSAYELSQSRGSLSGVRDAVASGKLMFRRRSSQVIEVEGTIPKHLLSYVRKPFTASSMIEEKSCPEGSVGALTGRADNYFISQTDVQRGSYLSVDTALVFTSDSSQIVSTGGYSSWNLYEVKIRSCPGYSSMITQLHQMYNSLGHLLENCPNLVRFQTLNEEGFAENSKKDKVRPNLTDEEISRIAQASDGNSGNSLYFNRLKSSAILSSPELFEIAVRAMHQFRAAYSQSTDNNPALENLQDIFRRVWTISPEFLCKELGRSSIIPLLRELIDFDMIESASDVETIRDKDVAKAVGLRSTVLELKSLHNLNDTYRDIKNSLGFVTTFGSIISQINCERVFKINEIFQKLPQTCISRMHNVSLFIQKLKSYFQNDDADMRNIIFLLSKLKNFDNAKDLLETEFDICNTLYETVVDHEKEMAAFEEEKNEKESKLDDENEKTDNSVKVKEINFGDLLLADAENVVRSQPKKKKIMKASTPATLHSSYQAFVSERDSLFGVISKCRMFLLYRLKTAGDEIRSQIQQYHQDISELTELITACSVVRPPASCADNEIENAHIESLRLLSIEDNIQHTSQAYSSLNDCKLRVSAMRENLDTNILSQRLLNEAHVIVGAADPFLHNSLLDNFSDMDKLEKFFWLKYQSCSSILDASRTVKKLKHSKFMTIEVPQMYKKFLSLTENRQYLMNISPHDVSTSYLNRIFNEMQPILQVVAFIKNRYMKIRHWERLNRIVLSPCGLELEVSTGMASGNFNLNEIESDTEKKIHSLGTLRSQQVKLLLDKGILKREKAMRNIAADACIEGMIEKTLEAVEHSMKTMKVVLSLDWLENKAFRGKIFFQLHRITNCTQIAVNIQYCLKALTVCEHTAFEMSIYIFDDKIHFMRQLLQDMYSLIQKIESVQRQWITVFHYVKFTLTGDIDRETERHFQSCTEELKKIELAVQSASSSNFYEVHRKINELSFGVDSTTNILSNVMDAVHGLVQSILDGFPRLSMLPYHRTKKLLRAWLVNPHENMATISRCITDMFPGVGKLLLVKDEDSLLPNVQGVCSNDGAEVINFSRPLSMDVALDEFLNLFESELRSSIASMSDSLVFDQVEMSREFFLDHSAEEIVKTIPELFSLRLDPVLNAPVDKRKSQKANQCVILVNMAMFSEHLWFCFGYSVGVIDSCRPDLASKSKFFSKKWKELIQIYIGVCKKNVKVIQLELQESSCDEKTRKLYSTLFQLEISYIQCLDELSTCICLESAVELWAGRYQIRYLYNKSERWRESPFEVTLGCVGLAYGLEYQGANVSVPTGHTLEIALQKVIGSAFVSKGTVFVSQDSDSTPIESFGEYSVSCNDVASALGRAFTTLSSVKCEKSIRFFLTRLCVLDAVGCIDFANLDHDGVQLLMTCMIKMWSAIENKEDQYIAKGLKYPLISKKDTVMSNPVQNGRQKATMMHIRKSLVSQGKSYSGIFVVGLASESLNSDVNLLDYFAKSAFNTVAVNFSRPVEGLGVELCTCGFKYGYLLQLMTQEVIILLHKKYNYQESITYLSSSLMIDTIVRECNSSLILARADLKSISRIPSDSELLRLEIECLYNVLLEQVILLGQCSKEDLIAIHKDVRNIIQQHLDTVLDKTNRFTLGDSTFLTEVAVSYSTRNILSRSMKSLGLLPGGQFMQQCSVLWKSLCSLQPTMILSGPAGCGKTAMLKCVIEALKKEGVPSKSNISNLIALEHWRAARVLLRVVRRWLSLRKGHKNIHSPKKPIGQTNDSSNSAKRIEAFHGKRQDIQTTVVHHASLPTEHLVGFFDEAGSWFDGLLLRLLRQTDERYEDELASGTESESIHVIVLEGPIGSNLEQLFTHTAYSSRSQLGGDNSSKLVFPSAENMLMRKRVSIVMETSDLVNTSPSLLMHTSHIHAGVSPEVAAERLLTAWMRSICNWLRPYPCWIEPLNFLNKTLLRSEFTKELVSCDISATDMNPVTAFSRMSTFIRYLEELLQQCHMLVVTTHNPKKENPPIDSLERKIDAVEFGDSNSDAEEEEELNESNRDLIFEVNIKEKEKLDVRVRLSLIYAAIWGFGGAINGSDRRVFFDRLMRDAIDKFIPVEEMDIKGILSVFDLAVNLPECCFVQALTLQKQVKETLVSKGDKTNRSVYIDPWSLNAAYRDNDSSIASPDTPAVPLETFFVSGEGARMMSHLEIRSPSNQAVSCAFETLVRTGSNVLCMGRAGVGKTRVLEESLNSLGANCPSPRSMKKDIMGKLLDIIGDEAVPDGIPSILEMLRKMVYEATYFDHQHDDDTNHILMWKKIRQSVSEIIPALMAKHDIHKHCDKKTVYTVKTSLCSTSSASFLREWLAREFHTENSEILESPRETYAMVFIDDVHLMTATEDDGSDDNNIQPDSNALKSREVSDRVASVIKGLVNCSRPYRVVTDLKLPSESQARGISHRNENQIYDHRCMPTSSNDSPVLHKSFGSDPAKSFFEYQNNYLISQVGVIAACTGDYKTLQNHSSISQLLSYFSVISVPQMSSDELQTAFASGSTEAIGCNLGLSSLVKSGKFIHELVQGTLKVFDNVFNSDLRLSSTERCLKEFIMPNMQWIGKFCGALRLGEKNLCSTSNLLHLWTHEWKRLTLDPLPVGTLRLRLTWAYRKLLNELDQTSWGLESGWFQKLNDCIEMNSGGIWVSRDIFCSASLKEKEFDGSNCEYCPMEIASGDSLESSETNRNDGGDMQQIRREILIPRLVGGSDVRLLLYQDAFSYVLRLVRLLTSVSTHIILPHKVGSHSIQALKLASSICDMRFFCFDCKDIREVSMISPSNHTKYSNDFRDFLKRSLLAVAGFKEIIRTERKHSIHHQHTPASVEYESGTREKVLMVINSIQLMSDHDRRLLQYSADLDNPCLVFNDKEISGLITATRRDLLSTKQRLGRKRHKGVQKESSTSGKSFEYSKGLPSSEEQCGLELVEECSEEDEISMSSCDDDADSIEDDESSSISHIEHNKTNADASELPTTQISFDDTKNFPRVREPSIKDDGKELKNHVMVGHDQFQTYVYQLVKSRLVDSIKTFFKIALLIDLPASNEIVASSGKYQFSFQPSSGMSKSENEASINKSTEGKTAKTSCDSNKLGDESRKASRASILKLRRPSRRFSMQSRSIAHRNAFATTTKSKTEKNKGGSERSTSGSGSGFEYVAPESSSDQEDPNFVFNCPILSKLLISRFSCLYWDICRSQSAPGICSAVLGMGTQRVLSSRGVDKTPNSIFENYTTNIRMRIVDPENDSDSDNKDGDAKGEVAVKSAASGKTSLGCSDVVEEVCFHTHRKNFLPKVSILDQIGVWGTFVGESLLSEEKASVEEEKSIRRRSLASIRKRMAFIKQNSRIDSSAANEFSEEVGDTIDAMVFEAQSLLSSLLTLPLPCDNIILTQPVVCIGAERGSEVASTIVRYIIETGGQSILRRKMHLATSLLLEDEAIQFLSHLEDNATELEHLEADLNSAIQDTNAKMTEVWASIEESQEEALDSSSFRILYETVDMAREDFQSSEVHSHTLQDEIDVKWSEELDALSFLRPVDWASFGSLFQGPVDESHILLMYCLLGLTDRIPLEAESANYKMERVKLSDDAIVKQSFSMLQTPEFVTMVHKIHPMKLTPAQVEHLIKINSKLSNMVEFLKQAKRHRVKAGNEPLPDVTDTQSVNERGGKTGESSCFGVDSEDSIGFDYFERTTFNVLVYFLDRMESIVVKCQRKKSFDKELRMRHAAIDVAQQELDSKLQEHIRELKSGYKLLEVELHGYDAELTKTQNKLKKISHLFEWREEYSQALSQNALYIEEEIKHIDGLLKVLVADTCAAATILVRAGWLPEQLRQECHDAIKCQMNRIGVNYSNSPYVLGGMMDRLQVRFWTQYNKGHLPRDVQAINSMSLMCLSPFYSFVIDPEGIGEKSIASALSNNFEVFSTTGNGFSLSELERQLVVFGGRMSDDDHLGFAIIVSDVQAGASDDLIAFLSADIDFVPPPGSFLPQENRTASSVDDADDVGIAFNPIFHGAFSPGNLMQLSRFRVIILSTQAPALDSHGVGVPLPPCCFKHMTIIHWLSCSQKSFFADSTEFSPSVNKEVTRSSLLEHIFVESLCKKISPSHFSKLQMINSRIIDLYSELFSIENAAFDTIIDWTKYSEENQSEALRNQQELYSNCDHLKDRHPIKLGVLDSQNCLGILKSAVSRRATLCKQILMSQSLERDCILYTGLLLEASNMSCSFFRMASALLPEHALPPHTLTSISIGAKCVQEFINDSASNRLLKCIPHSLGNARMIIEPLRLFQKMYCKRLAEKRDAQQRTDRNEQVSESDLKPKQTDSSSLLRRRSQFARKLSVSTGSDISHLLSSARDEGGIVSPKPGKIMREASYARKSSKLPTPRAVRMARIVKSLRMEEIVTIPATKRSALMSNVAVLIQPLHGLLLNASVKYLMENVKTGLEWMVKYCLVLASWSASVPLPQDETRLLSLLLNDHVSSKVSYFQVSSPRYPPHQVVILDPSKPDHQQHIPDKCMAYFDKLLQMSDKSYNGKRTYHIVRLLRKRRLTKLTISGVPTIFLVRHEQMPPEKYLRFSKDVRNKVDIADRVKSVLTNSIDISLEARLPRLPASVQCIDDRVASLTSWSGKGSGGLDGVWMNRCSQRYQVTSLPGVGPLDMESLNSRRACSGPRKDWDVTFCGDRHDSIITDKSCPSMQHVRHGDAVLVEYLKIMGMKFPTETSGLNSSSVRTSGDPDEYGTGKVTAADDGNGSVGSEPEEVRRRSMRPSRPTSTPRPPPNASPSTSSNLRRAMRFRTVRRQSMDSRSVSTKRRRSSSSKDSPGAQLPFGRNRRQSSSTRLDIEEKKSLTKLLSTSDSVQKFKLLEKHSVFSPVFRGIEEGILNHRREFDNWKNFLESLISIDFNNLSDGELVVLAAKVVPPQLNFDEHDDEGLGCWALGQELTILQTLILTAILAPHAIEGVIGVMLALLADYLTKGNVILKHKDEYLKGDLSDEEGEDGMKWRGDRCEANDMIRLVSVNDGAATKHELLEDSSVEEQYSDSDEGEDIFDESLMKLSAIAASAVSTAEENDDDVTDDVERFQVGSCLFNSWTHLKRIAASKRDGIQIRLSSRRGQSLLCCRDFENWEEVLLSWIRQASNPKKFQLISQLRNCFDGSSPLFLSSKNFRKNTATLTNRAREYANQHSVNSSQMTVMNCRLCSIEPKAACKRLNFNFADRQNASFELKRFKEAFFRAVKPDVDKISMRSVSVEMIDMNSGFGCALLNHFTKSLTYDLRDEEAKSLEKSSSGSGALDALGAMGPAISPGARPSASDWFYTESPKTAATPDRKESSVRGRQALFKKTSSVNSSHLTGYSRGRVNVLMSAKWSQEWYGTGPPLVAAMLRFHWLPEISLPDLVGCAHLSTLSPDSAILASRDLSFGAIGDELEGQLHWVMNSLKRVTSTRMSKSVRERIRYSSKVELRSLAGVISLWRFALCVQCKQHELKNEPAQWSSVLVPLSLWQLARLSLKLSDILFDVEWHEMAADYSVTCEASPGSKQFIETLTQMLLDDSRFVKSLCMLIESFSKVSFSSEMEGEEPIKQEEVAAPPSPESSPKRSRSRLSMLVRQDSQKKKDGKAKGKGFLSSYKEVHDQTVRRGKNFLLGERLAESANSQAAPPKPPPAQEKEKPSERRRRLREAKKAELIAAANSNYMSFESLSSPNLLTLGPDPRLLMSSNLRTRLFGALSEFVAGVIYVNAMTRRQAAGGGIPETEKSRPRTSSSDALHPSDLSKKDEEVVSFLTPDERQNEAEGGHGHDNGGASWPKISPRDNDITIGSLMPYEVVSTLVSWVFDGVDFSVEKKSKAASKKLINKFKRSFGIITSRQRLSQTTTNEEKFTNWKELNRMKERMGE